MKSYDNPSNGAGAQGNGPDPREKSENQRGRGGYTYRPYPTNDGLDDRFQDVWDDIYHGRASDEGEPEGPPIIAPPRVRAEVRAPAPPKKRKGKVRPRRHGFRRVLVMLAVLTALYCTAVFSHIPFIEKWRTIYIETAMTTKSHQWLATAFLPKNVVDQVIMSSSRLTALQAGLSSDWNVSGFDPKGLYQPWSKAKKKFAELYSEIDQDSFNAFLSEHPDEFIDGNGYLVIDRAGLKDGGTSIRTVQGDQVLAVDTENAITIVKITGDGYVARLAIIKDPSRVGVGLSPDFDETGATIGDLAEYNDAVLAINASGFNDPNGKGDGGNAYGLVVKDGKVLKDALGYSYKTIALDYNNRLYVGNFKSLAPFRDAVEFIPALIIDGEVLVSGSAGWGIQPRSAVGQTEDGDILLLIVDGRAPGYSIGCTVGELAQIMKRYGAYQACNLDGGSSSLLYYNGREISRPSAANKTNGRRVPDGFVVYGRSK